MTKLAYDIAAAAGRYSVSPDLIRRAIKAGELDAKNVGRKYLISAKALEEWFDGLADA